MYTVNILKYIYIYVYSIFKYICNSQIHKKILIPKFPGFSQRRFLVSQLGSLAQERQHKV